MYKTSSSTWTGQGGSLDNQYITNTQGYITGFTDTNISTTGATFNSSNGVVTFTKNNSDTYTVDIDGRFYYQTTIMMIGTIWKVKLITSLMGPHLSQDIIGLIGIMLMDGETTHKLDISHPIIMNILRGQLNTSNGLITFTRNDGDTFTVDIDGRFLTSFTETDPVFSRHLQRVSQILISQIGILPWMGRSCFKRDI